MLVGKGAGLAAVTNFVLHIARGARRDERLHTRMVTSPSRQHEPPVALLRGGEKPSSTGGRAGGGGGAARWERN